jgi:hypothetical protein
MISAFHWFLALASAVAITLAGLEASRRALLKRQPGALAARIAGIVVLLGPTAASGGMFLGGTQPHKKLHFNAGAGEVEANREHHHAHHAMTGHGVPTGRPKISILRRNFCEQSTSGLTSRR